MAPFLILALFSWTCSPNKKGEHPHAPSGKAHKPVDKVTSGENATEPRIFKKIPRKLLLIGLDGATWKVLDPMLKTGKLPNFQKLIDNGVRAPLKTYEPTASPLIWTTIATGVEYEKHGIADFTVKIPNSDESVLPTSNLRRVKALWNILSESSYSVGVTGWWATYPAEKVTGYIISDQADTLRTKSYRIALEMKGKPRVNSNEQTFPKDLQNAIGGAIEASPNVGGEHLKRFMNLPKKSLLRLINEKDKIDVHDIASVFRVALLIDQAFIEGGIYAMEKYKTDFSAIYLNGLDAAEHHFWKYFEPEKFKNVDKKELGYYKNVIEEYYIYMDETLGRILQVFENEPLTVIVVSDHGHEANPLYNPESDDKFNRICSGTHDKAPDGIVILSGKDIEKGATLSRTSVYDIAPTILALMGVPVGRDMPGRVIKEAVSPAFLNENPISWTPTHSSGWTYTDTPVRSEMGEALKDKLRGLGYIR